MTRKIVCLKDMPEWKHFLSYGNEFEYDGYTYKLIEEHNNHQHKWFTERNRIFKRSDNKFFSYNFLKAVSKSQEDECEAMLNEVFRTAKTIYVYK